VASQGTKTTPLARFERAIQRIAEVLALFEESYQPSAKITKLMTDSLWLVQRPNLIANRCKVQIHARSFG